MKEILLGTHNVHKVKEITALLDGLPVRIKTLNDFPDIKPVEEDGRTLEENATKKAVEYAHRTNLFTLADDTGLEVPAIRNEPGVYSARYAGENCTFADNNRKLLERMKSLKGKKRAARFRCVIACCNPDTNMIRSVEGAIHGSIVEKIKGAGGFGYDPVFYVPELKRTLAEMTLDEKNSISHRGEALRKAKKILRDYLS